MHNKMYIFKEKSDVLYQRIVPYIIYYKVLIYQQIVINCIKTSAFGENIL